MQPCFGQKRVYRSRLLSAYVKTERRYFLNWFSLQLHHLMLVCCFWPLTFQVIPSCFSASTHCQSPARKSRGSMDYVRRFLVHMKSMKIITCVKFVGATRSKRWSAWLAHMVLRTILGTVFTANANRSEFWQNTKFKSIANGSVKTDRVLFLKRMESFYRCTLLKC